MPSKRPAKVTLQKVFKSDPKENLVTAGLPRNNGLKKEDLMKNKRGKVVSIAASQRSKAKYEGSDLNKWMKCVRQVHIAPISLAGRVTHALLRSVASVRSAVITMWPLSSRGARSRRGPRQ